MYVTAQNIAKLTPQELLQEFMEAIKELIDMDALDYADNYNAHSEWVARECWARMRDEDKNMIKEYVPTIENCMRWEDMSDSFQTDFSNFYIGYYN